MDDSTTDTGDASEATSDETDRPGDPARPEGAAADKRRRGSRGGQGRTKSASAGNDDGNDDEGGADSPRDPEELPEPMSEGKVKDAAVAERALVRKPQIGDTRPLVPTKPPPGPATSRSDEPADSPSRPEAPEAWRRKGKGGGQQRDAGRSQKGRAERDRPTVTTATARSAAAAGVAGPSRRQPTRS